MLRIFSCFVLSLSLSATPLFAQETEMDGGPSGAFTYSADADVAAVQREVKQVVLDYQAGLNASDWSMIAPLFAPDAVAEWNDKETKIGPPAMEPSYLALFEEIDFETDFQFDAIDVYDDIAIVRTHHPVGQAELHLEDGSRTLDFNREIFVLRRFEDRWKIIVYTFNTQPKQGEQ